MSAARLAAATLLATTALASPLAAQSAAEISMLRAELADTRERLDALEQNETNLETDRSGVTLTFGGRVNQMVLFASQGDRDQTFVADNDASASRLEFLAESVRGDTTAGLEIVMSVEVNSSDSIDFGSTFGGADEDGPAGDFRQAHFFVENPNFGYISVGQGDTAAEDTAHVDFSGTDFAGSGSDVDDIAGGLHFYDDDGNDLAELDDFFVMQDGSRQLRVYYETPSFNGFSGKISFANSDSGSDGDDDLNGSGVQTAVGLAYGAEMGFGEVAGELSWRRDRADDDVDNDFLVGSASVLFNSGFNLTAAASTGEIDGSSEDPTAYFVKAGYIANLTDMGETRFSVDFFRGHNNADFAGPSGDLPEATSYGVFAVQAISDLNTELYVGARVYELDDVYIDDDRSEVDDMTAVLAGARIRF